MTTTDSVDRFEREARAAARLNHPNIVRILDFGVDGGLYYMIQDLIIGESLRDRLTELHSSGGTLRTDAVIAHRRAGGRAPSPTRTNMATSIATSSRATSSSTAMGRAYLTDFGVVKIAGSQLRSPRPA